MDTLAVILVFVDGLGMGAAGSPDNPLEDVRKFPFLHRACMQDGVPLDACLGVPGVPQSATGQTALLTGVNAPALAGGHREGFPDAFLRDLIDRNSIFSVLSRCGCTATFANAYRQTEYARMKRRSVTTVAARACPGGFRGLDDLRAGNAVYQDITNALLAEGGYDVPVIAPEEAARNLVSVARQHRFTLFEYFQTDRAAHRGTRDDAERVLGTLERFMRALLEITADERILCVLTSDHGNIEDLSVRHHTRNPVPLFAAGPGAALFTAGARRLTDVPSAVLRILGCTDDRSKSD